MENFIFCAVRNMSSDSGLNPFTGSFSLTDNGGS